MVARFDALRIAASDPSTLARFWAEVLGARTTTPVGGAGAAVDVEPQDATSVRLRFVPEQRPRAGRGWLHLHLTAASLEDQARVVGRCRALGAQHVDVGQLPEEDHVVLADPEGNELCVVREGSFLAGTGFLGEVACDGTRDVGLFWSAALGWPLVWDHDEETAVQSPAGGTKIAWGGPPLADPDGQRFRLHRA